MTKKNGDRNPRKVWTDTEHGPAGGPIGSHVFNPSAFFLDPGNYKKLRGRARKRFLRDAGPDFWRASPRARAGAIEAAEQAAIDVMYDLDWQARLVSADNVADAVAMVVGYCSRAKWRIGIVGAGRCQARLGARYLSSMSAHGDNPAAIVATAEGWGEDALESIVGGGMETKTLAAGEYGPEYAVACEGGRAYLATEGEMVSTTERYTWADGSGEQEWNGVPIPYRYAKTARPGGWKMVRGVSHHPTEFGPGHVVDHVDVPDAPRFNRQPAATAPACYPQRPALARHMERLAAGRYDGRARVVLAGMDAEPIK